MRRDEILCGDLPTLADLLVGHPFRSGDFEKDVRSWAHVALNSLVVCRPERGRADLGTALHELLGDVSLTNVAEAGRELERLGTLAAAADEKIRYEGRVRCDLYAVAGFGALEPRARLIGAIMLLQGRHHQHHLLAMAAGLRFRMIVQGGRHPKSPGDLHSAGGNILRSAARRIGMEMIAQESVVSGPPPAEDMTDLLDEVMEDRGEIVRAPGGLAQLRESRVIGLQVVPKQPTAAPDRLWKPFTSIAGRRLPLVRRGDVAAHRRSLVRRAPHAEVAIDTILRDLAASELAWIRPTLLVGPAGAGKTSLARAIAETVGLPVTTYAAGGIADASMMGTSAQWSTSRPSVPLDLIRSSGVANPLIVLDEVDKTQSSHNGSLVDALLAFLEPSTSRRYRDLAIEVEVDLSRVSWIATANRLDDVPRPLLDRLRVIQVEEPTWAHVGDLARGILNDIAAERDLDRRWLEELATDELQVLRRAWNGGSIRRLRRALEVLVDGRDMQMGRA
ncbi:AAA family ATPase [Chenggangzhangella methanolivorans]|uniref:AAA family ATPase n=1 Tax=Chenggangzhangella methanolivorans TaxID=1437009 RepID=UPI0036080F3A